MLELFLCMTPIGKEGILINDRTRDSFYVRHTNFFFVCPYLGNGFMSVSFGVPAVFCLLQPIC